MWTALKSLKKIWLVINMGEANGITDFLAIYGIDNLDTFIIDN